VEPLQQLSATIPFAGEEGICRFVLGPAMSRRIAGGLLPLLVCFSHVS